MVPHITRTLDVHLQEHHTEKGENGAKIIIAYADALLNYYIFKIPVPIKALLDTASRIQVLW